MAGAPELATTSLQYQTGAEGFFHLATTAPAVHPHATGAFLFCLRMIVPRTPQKGKTIMSTAISNPGSRQVKPQFRPFETLRNEFDDLFARLGSDWDGKWLTSEFKAACDLSETADAYQVRMDVPGIKPDDITVQVTGDRVHVSGERKEEKEEKTKTFHRVERRSGKFSEVISLPSAVNDEQVQAEFHDGVLTISLPKTDGSKTRTVKVKTTNGK